MNRTKTRTATERDTSKCLIGGCPPTDPVTTHHLGTVCQGHWRMMTANGAAWLHGLRAEVASDVAEAGQELDDYLTDTGGGDRCRRKMVTLVDRYQSRKKVLHNLDLDLFTLDLQKGREHYVW